MGAAADERMPAPSFTFAEVFAGIGGFRIGLEAAGGRCVFACDYCSFAKACYRRYHGDQPLPVGDIRRICAAQVPPHDVLAAGFPCQSFSNAGRCGGFGDERGQLFYELVRLARECRPRALLLENVRGLLTMDGAMDEIRHALSEAGYPEVQWRLLDAALLVPQRRRRLFLIAFRSEAARRSFVWPELPALRRTAEAVLEHPHGTRAPLNEGLTLPVDKWHKVQQSAYYVRFRGARVLPEGAVAQTLQTTYKGGCLLYSQFVPQSPPPDTASSATGSPSEDLPPRFYSERECARLMGFPEDFPLPAAAGVAYRLLGNAVCPPLVGALGGAIAAALRAADVAAAEWVGDEVGGDKSARQASPQGEAGMREGEVGAQREAVRIALELCLAASPTGREPGHCWLADSTALALGLQPLTSQVKSSQLTPGLQPPSHRNDEGRRELGLGEHELDPQELELDEAMCGLDLADTPAGEVAAAARVGAAFHVPLEVGWGGPYPLEAVLTAARRRRSVTSSLGEAMPMMRRVSRLRAVGDTCDALRPSQTLPAPTNAIKSELAASCMRRYLMVSHLCTAE